ncbi:MAG: asparaginase, partial [Oscillospiraceae bacterium]|nr:asparaginase [Oscillospiraceae bacterium]
SDFSHKAGLIKITPMTRPEEIETAAKLYDGIVIEGYGIGAIPTRLLPAIKKSISGGVKCVLISQCLFEGVSMGVYEVGTQAKDIGVISGGDLTAEGALARLMFGEI